MNWATAHTTIAPASLLSGNHTNVPPRAHYRCPHDEHISRSYYKSLRNDLSHTNLHLQVKTKPLLPLVRASTKHHSPERYLDVLGQWCIPTLHTRNMHPPHREQRSVLSLVEWYIHAFIPLFVSEQMLKHSNTNRHCCHDSIMDTQAHHNCCLCAPPSPQPSLVHISIDKSE